MIQDAPAQTPYERYKSLKAAPPPEAAPSPAAPPPSKPKSVGGFVENALDDTWDFAKGLYNIVPGLYNRVNEIVKNPGQYAKDVELLFSKDYFGSSLGAVKDALLENYKKYGSEVVYHKPFSTLVDAVTLVSGGGALIKASGKIAGVQKMVEAGKFLEALPGKVMRTLIDKGVYGATGGAFDLAKAREFKMMKGEEVGRKMLKMEDDAKAVLLKVDALSPEEKAIFHQARALGDAPGIGVAEERLAQAPKVKAALEAYAPLERELTGVYQSRGMLPTERAEGAIAKKFALEAFGDVGEESITKAKAILGEMKAAGKRLPMYGPNIVKKGGKVFSAEDLLSDMISGGRSVRETKVGPLEVMKGAPEYSKDPSVYTREMIKAARGTEQKARLSERLMQSPELVGGKAEGMKPEAIPEGIGRKYYEDPVRAEMLKGIQDPTIKRLLKWEYIHTQSGLIRAYDAVYRVFATMATRLNPKWVTGNIVGDAVLGMLAGSDLRLGRQFLKSRAMPSQIAATRAGLETVGNLERKGILGRTLDRYGDIAGEVDQATRAGIVTREVGRHLKEAGASFEGSASTLEEVLRSTEQFSDMQVEMQRLREEVARRSLTVQKRDRELVSLMKREEVLHPKLEAIDLKRQLKTQGKLAPIEEQAAAQEKYIKELAPSVTEYSDEFKSWPEWQKAQELRAEAEAVRHEGVLGAAGQKGFEKGMSKIEAIRQAIVNKTSERNAIVRDIMDDLTKSGELDRRLPGLRAQVDIARHGVERANAFIGDYLGLDGFEQGVLRRIIPFYPWTKAMTMLAFRLPFLAPVKSFAWNRYSAMLMTMTEDKELPKEFRGRVPVGALADGRTVWWKTTQFSPFEGLQTKRVGDIPVPSMLNVVERNPVLALGFRIFGGKTIFDASAIPYGEQITLAGDGTVTRYKGNGTIEKEIPQTPLVSGVMHFFPVVQYAQSVLTPYWTNKYNWAGYPEPVLNPDGTYKYPRELQDRMAALVGVNLMSRSREDIIRSQKIKEVEAMKSLRKAYLKAGGDAEERELILNAMHDYPWKGR